jgi:hypothetical protein
MNRHCARPGCHGYASSTLSYDYADHTVWLQALSAEDHPMTHDLCDHHADTLSVPRGWELQDRRSTVPLPLFGDQLAS